ncbi:hypothetical protein GOO32_003003 [Salmonella enterica]|nr:hypothetical protein [Salmonella enterica]EDQ0146111.1 hypothetical protein [Salmonella enterica subsp. enterica serovar Sandiego]EDR7077753.1 hypothetical protein [Salmonella enterica subsp. enterica serovar Gatuni]EDT0686190.1 hypothetical protein [Salmonella enterica subsp. enterica serovar Kokomlemle]EDU5438773.1 hypothetical protein [Salmonella enterica subsp. enterica serovar Hadar]EDX6972699.1 hypothetical protein [Salmonella enterica subsp. enterica]EEE1373127.1 hypothetical protei
MNDITKFSSSFWSRMALQGDGPALYQRTGRAGHTVVVNRLTCWRNTPKAMW